MDIYLIILVVLLTAAVIDLIVGVANDAVNFLNSAIGAMVAKRVTIMLVATAGIMAGVLFSSGLMEIARKGIFYPQLLTFPEVMYIFAAVMITDVLLLDFFNTFGLPTSTTVSLVFELLGAAFAISMIKVLSMGDNAFAALSYINTESVFKILFGIVASVVAAFFAGSIIQYFSRMLFSFRLEKTLKRYGALWGGVALSAIIVFILLKGAKGATFISKDTAGMIKDNIWVIAVYAFLGCALLLQMLTWFTKVNIFKPIILVGTFALAMAFAANDLVNFIGAPMGGLAAYRSMDPALDPWSQTMGALAEPVRANPWLLLLAGGIMAATLWVSKKARGVTATSLNLGRQSEGAERFQSIAPARSIVRIVLAVFRFFSFITPEPLKRRVESRFDNSYWKPVPDENGEVPSFDTLRAAVNLLVSAMLITIGTTLKLPLSTTYVTFMVAMATALPDRAWGRDSAVYRVSGVLTVIGGWFFTAFMAASVAAIIATIIFYGELVGIVLLIALAAFILVRTTYVHRKREKEYEEEVKAMRLDEGDFDESIANLILNLGGMIERVGGIVQSTYDGLMKENRSQLKDMRNQTKQLNKQHKILSSHILRTSRLEELEEAVEEKTYGEALSSLHLLMRSLRHLTSQCYVHIDNNHSGFTEEQVTDIEPVLTVLHRQLTEIAAYLKEKDFSAMAEINEETEETIHLIRKANKAQLKRSKKEKYTTRTSLLFLELLTECEEILFHARMLLFLCNECHGGEPFILPMKEEVEEEIEESDDRP